MSFPYLSLKNITIDPALAQRIPRYLAYYHLALPVAEDENQITLVMVHPDNEKVRDLFEEHLSAKVFPVQGNRDEIKATLDLLYAGEGIASVPHILSWSDSQPDAVLDSAWRISRAFSEDAVCLDASQNSLDTVLQIAGRYTLAVVDTQAGGATSQLLRKSQTSLFLLRGTEVAFSRILVALQGHSPDRRTLEMVAPLARMVQGRVTILGVAAPMKRHNIQGLATLLNPTTQAGAHVQECVALARESGIDGHLKLRQGLPHEQIAAEFVDGNYDILAIAVETYGAFVSRIVQAIETRAPENQKHILAVKPTVE
ncbi:MAG: universal stress protein [Anaerolineae bacterium]|nr:universal stress protein [Anaerolineae bacterium]